MAPSFIPKIVRVNGAIVKFVQGSLSTVGGYGETNVRTQVSGRQTEQVSSDNLDSAISQVNFDMIVSDTGDSTDIRRLIKGWKSNNGNNSIFIEGDGGNSINQNFVNMSLVNDPMINESPDGVVSLSFMGQTVQIS